MVNPIIQPITGPAVGNPVTGAAAYSQLSTDASGNLLATPFTPDLLPTLLAWWKADGITGKNDGDKVGDWAESGGGGHDLNQGTSGAQPVYKASIINGKPVLRFTAANSTFLYDATIPAFLPMTIFAVMKIRSGTDNQYLLDASGTNGRAILYSSSNGLEQFGGGSFANALAWDTSNFHIVSAVFANVNAGSQFWKDSGTPANGPQLIGPSTVAAGLSVGASSSAGADFADVDIAEIIVFGASLGTGARKQVEQYLASKYGLTLTA